MRAEAFALALLLTLLARADAKPRAARPESRALARIWMIGAPVSAAGVVFAGASLHRAYTYHTPIVLLSVAGLSRDVVVPRVACKMHNHQPAHPDPRPHTFREHANGNNRTCARRDTATRTRRGANFAIARVLTGLGDGHLGALGLGQRLEV